MNLVACYAPGQVMRHILGSLFAVLLGYWLTTKMNPKGIFVGYVAIVFFGPIGLVHLRRIWDHREILRIDSTGIMDQRVLTKMVPWQEVEGIREVTIRRQTMFMLKLSRSPREYIGTRYKRFITSMNAR